MPKRILDYLPPTYKLHTKEPLEFDAVQIGRLIAEFPGMTFYLLSNIKSKFMVGVAFVLFVLTTIAHAGGS